MVTPTDLAPKAPQFAVLAPGEQHLHSFILNPVRQVRSGGLLIKMTVWEQDGTRHMMHLTDRRIILEPLQIGAWEIVLAKVVRAAAGAVAGDGAAGALYRTDQDIKRFQDARESLRMVEGQWLAMPYSEISDVAVFRQGLGKFVRLHFRSATEPFNTAVAGAHQGAVNLGCVDEFVRVLNQLRGA